MNSEKTAVVGAGLMGTDISYLLAKAGYEVVLIDIDEDVLESAREEHSEIEYSVDSDATISTKDTITYSTNLDRADDAYFVVEAITERLEAKKSLMKSLEGIVNDDTVIGTNTSSLTPSEISTDMAHPERVVLFHFANPALERDLVEVSGDKATPGARETACLVAKAIGKTPVLLEKECRSHVLSRLSAAVKCSATWELLDYEPEAIDTTAKKSGFERGPVELIDLIGIDVHLATVSNLAESYGDRFAPPPKLEKEMREMIENGNLGRKTGQGFFEWNDDEPVIPEPNSSYDISPILSAMINEAHRIVEDRVTTRPKVDEILRLGSGGEAGPFDLLEMLGREYVVETLKERYDETGARVYEPADTLVENY